MPSLKSIDLDISERLKAKPYREAFFESWTEDEIAVQIRSLREKRNLRQVDLAESTGMKQSAISRLEQATYSRWGFQTLLRLSRALDARVRIIFEPAEDVIRQYEQQASDRSNVNVSHSSGKATQSIEPSHLSAKISNAPEEFDPDRPISPGDSRDKLGFRSVASMLATSLLTQTTSKGLVVSIEGRWGSGKSSLVNYLAHELRNAQDNAPEIVRFEPWLVGDRDGMLVELMSDLAFAVEAIEAPDGDQKEKIREHTKKVAAQLRGYASKLSRGAAPIAQLAGLLGLPAADLVSKTLSSVADATSVEARAIPLPDLKGKLTDGLRELPRRILVVIDDLDRLEPQEAAEVMRLIRAVADFPNVIYVLCYDQEILAENLKEALSIKDGAAFLEKVVQVRFRVPQPEAFDLRRWFLDECQAFYDSQMAQQLSEDARERLQRVCGVEGGLLQTPRDVVRTMNAIRLYWPPISDKADYPDLVWLQIIRLSNEHLYSWVEHYLSECAAVSEGASINESEKIELGKQLKKLLPDDSIGSARSVWALKDFVPGIQAGEKVENKDRLFNLSNEPHTASFERDRRIGSAQHSRYYFSFAKPAGALEDSHFYGFISSAKAGEDLSGRCAILIDGTRPQGGTKFDVLIDRLNRLDEAELPASAAPRILKALANHMDEAGHKAGKGQWGVRWSWRSADHLFRNLIARIPDYERQAIIDEIFATGEAIGWLTTELMRDEIFAHGRYGDRRKSEEEWIFSDEELDRVITLLQDRFKTTERENIIDTPEVLGLMYGWQQSGDHDGVSEWVTEQQSTDVGFLKLLNVCRGWVASDKVYHPLNRRDLKHFLDFDEALERLRGIADNVDKTEAERAKAQELLQAAEMGDDD